jgi:hypothetical protein
LATEKEIDIEPQTITHEFQIATKERAVELV